MSKRPAMLGSVIRTIIAPVLRTCPPECGMVSITNVDVSSDTSYATVYISALSHADIALRFLESRVHELQRQLGKELARKRVPLLRFRLDTTVEEADRVEKLLQQLEEKSDE